MFEQTIRKQPLYDPASVQWMRDELIYVGFEEMLTPEAVEFHLRKNDDEVKLVVLNSVCGCAAGSARPGVSLALQNDLIPDKLLTSFAGQDRDAVDYLRSEFLKDYPPSSPMMALFKNSQVIYIIHRYQIEGRTPEQIAADLIEVFNKVCKRKGPSIPKEKYEQLVHAKACGQAIPLNKHE